MSYTDQEAAMMEALVDNFMQSPHSSSVISLAKSVHGARAALLLSSRDDVLPDNTTDSTFHGVVDVMSIEQVMALLDGDEVLKDMLESVLADGQFPVCFRLRGDCLVTKWQRTTLSPGGQA